MQPAIRTQHDNDQELYSLESGLDCSDLPDTARQEFKTEADVNYILDRFGLNTPVQRQPQFGDVDFDLDLHTAYIAIGDAQRAFRQLPAAVREQFPTPRAMLDAMNSGDLTHALRNAAQAAELEAAQRPPPQEPPQ